MPSPLASGLFVAVKRVAREAHDLAGLKDVLKLFGQIQQADFMGDNFLATTDHEGYLLRFQ